MGFPTEDYNMPILTPPAYNQRSMPLELRLDDVLRLRKPHPCGGYDWQVVRLGADIGIKCLKCERRILLTRSVFERRVKRFVKKAND